MRRKLSLDRETLARITGGSETPPEPSVGCGSLANVLTGLRSNFVTCTEGNSGNCQKKVSVNQCAL